MNFIEAFKAAKTKTKMIRRIDFGKSLDSFQYVGYDEGGFFIVPAFRI